MHDVETFLVSHLFNGSRRLPLTAFEFKFFVDRAFSMQGQAAKGLKISLNEILHHMEASDAFILDIFGKEGLASFKKDNPLIAYYNGQYVRFKSCTQRRKHKKTARKPKKNSMKTRKQEVIFL